MISDRTLWPAYTTVPMTPGSYEYDFATRMGAPTEFSLRECPVCGARERFDAAGRLQVDHCNLEKHTPAESAPADLPVVRRTGEADLFGGE